MFLQTAVTTNIKAEAEKVFEIRNIDKLITKIFSVCLIIASIAVLFYLLWGSLDWILSEGDQEKIKKARGKITAAITGLVILAISWALWLLILYFLGLGTIDPINPFMVRFKLDKLD